VRAGQPSSLAFWAANSSSVRMPWSRSSWPTGSAAGRRSGP